MKKTLLILLIMIPLFASAQEKRKSKFDFEFGLGYSFAAQKQEAVDMKYKMGFHIEGRYNLRSIPLDVGVHIGYSSVQRIERWTDPKYRSMSVLAVGDYSFRRGKRINPYVGMGVGVAFNNTVAIFNDGYSTKFCIMPRVGVKFFNHLNLSLSYAVIDKSYSRSSINLGFFF